MKKLLLFLFLLVSIPHIYGQYSVLFSASSEFTLTDLGSKLLAHWPDARNTSNVTIVGGKVSNWIETVNNRPFAQATDANRPLYNNDAIEFNAAATNQGLVSTFSRNSNNVTFFMVLKNLSFQNPQYLLHGSGTSQMIIQQFIVNGFNKFRFYLPSDAVLINISNFIPDNNYHIFVFEKKSTACNLSYDTNNFTEDYPATGSFNFSQLTLGNISGLNYDTKIAVREIIATTGTLTKQQKYDVINYLNKIYQISIPSRLISSSNRYNSYIQGTHVLFQQVGGVNQANTGLTYDPVLKQSYVSQTPRGYIQVYDSVFNNIGEINCSGKVGQGLAKDYVNGCFYAWVGTTLYKLALDGSEIWNQAFNPLGGLSAGHIALDYSETNLVLWASTSGATAVAKWTLNPTSGRFETTATISVSNGKGGEGIAYDPRDNTLWIHQNDIDPTRSVLCHIKKDGTVIASYSCQANCEGIAVNVSKGLIYSSHDSWYHGGATNGNCIQEYYPDFLSN